MEVIFMPAWANFIAVVAIILLCATAWGGKINSMSNITLTKANFKGAYYAFSALATVLLAGFFFMQAPVEAGGLMIGIIVGVLFCAFLATFVVCADAEKGEYFGNIMLVGSIAIGVIVLVVMLFANPGYAALWAGSVVMFGTIGHFLFPSTKGEKK